MTDPIDPIDHDDAPPIGAHLAPDEEPPDTITLAPAAFDRLLEILRDPRPPTPALVQLMRRART